MRELLVMRHAKSAWNTGARDFDRPLNDRGIDDSHAMARWLHSEGRCPQAVLSSSALRAQLTVDAVARVCGLDDAVIELRRTLYLADIDDWYDRLRHQTADRLLICGHNPGLDDLVVELVGSVPPLSAKGKLMTTSAIAHLVFDGAWEELGPGGAALFELKRPRA